MISLITKDHDMLIGPSAGGWTAPPRDGRRESLAGLGAPAG